MTVVIVPAKGYQFGGLQITGSTAFGTVGPIPPGVWIKRINFGFFASDLGTVLVGFTLGSSGEANEASFRSGSSIINDSRIPLLGKPMIEFVHGGATVQSLVIAVGRRVVSSAQFVVCAFTETAGFAVASGNYSVETVCAVDLASDVTTGGVGVESGRV